MAVLLVAELVLLKDGAVLTHLLPHTSLIFCNRASRLTSCSHSLQNSSDTVGSNLTDHRTVVTCWVWTFLLFSHSASLVSCFVIVVSMVVKQPSFLPAD